MRREDRWSSLHDWARANAGAWSGQDQAANDVLELLDEYDRLRDAAADSTKDNGRDHLMCDHKNRETAMTVLRRDADGAPTVWCDPCLAPLVGALNDGGIRTVASCCGHGRRPGNVILADGRELVIAPDHETARQVDRAFPPINRKGSTMTETSTQDWARSEPTEPTRCSECDRRIVARGFTSPGHAMVCSRRCAAKAETSRTSAVDNPTP